MLNTREHYNNDIKRIISFLSINLNEHLYFMKVHNGGATADGARVRQRFGDVHHMLPARDAH